MLIVMIIRYEIKIRSKKNLNNQILKLFIIMYLLGLNVCFFLFMLEVEYIAIFLIKIFIFFSTCSKNKGEYREKIYFTKKISIP